MLEIDDDPVLKTLPSCYEEAIIFRHDHNNHSILEIMYYVITSCTAMYTCILSMHNDIKQTIINSTQARNAKNFPNSFQSPPQI